MANTKQAKKRAAQSDRKRARNRSVVTRVRHTVRDLRKATESDPKKAAELLPKTESEIDVAARKGVIHKRTASRLKSRVARATNKATAAKKSASAASTEAK